MSYSITFGNDYYLLNIFGSETISFSAKSFTISASSVPNYVILGNPGNITSVNYLNCVSPKASSVNAFINAVLALSTGNNQIDKIISGGSINVTNNLTIGSLPEIIIIPSQIEIFNSSLNFNVGVDNSGFFIYDGSNSTNALTINPSNNVSINQNLSVANGVNCGGLNIVNSSGNNYITIYPENATVNGTGFLWQIGSSSAFTPANNLTIYNNNLGNAPLEIYYASDTLLLAATINFSSQTGIGYQQLTPSTGTGSITCVMPFQGTYYKKVIIYYNDYENTSSTTLTYTFPVAFSAQPITATTNSSAPAQTLNTNTSGQYVSITFPAGMTAAYTGFGMLEGM